MNYQRHYDALMSRARNRKLQGYKERHHVIPRCMGGLDKKDNLVDLTPEEHYVAHQLLVKIHPKIHRLVHAAMMMSQRCTGNKSFGWLRRRMAINQVGNKHSLGKRHSAEVKKFLSELHTGKIVSEETRRKISEAGKGRAPANKGVPVPQERREKISKALTGLRQSDATKAKRSASLVGKRKGIPGRKWTDEERARVSAAMKGRPKSSETKAKMSAAQMGNAKALGLVRGPQSPEHTRKLAESRRRNKELKEAA